VNWVANRHGITSLVYIGNVRYTIVKFNVKMNRFITKTIL